MKKPKFSVPEKSLVNGAGTELRVVTEKWEKLKGKMRELGTLCLDKAGEVSKLLKNSAAKEARKLLECREATKSRESRNSNTLER